MSRWPALSAQLQDGAPLGPCGRGDRGVRGWNAPAAEREREDEAEEMQDIEAPPGLRRRVSGSTACGESEMKSDADDGSGGGDSRAGGAEADESEVSGGQTPQHHSGDAAAQKLRDRRRELLEVTPGAGSCLDLDAMDGWVEAHVTAQGILNRLRELMRVAAQGIQDPLQLMEVAPRLMDIAPQTAVAAQGVQGRRRELMKAAPDRRDDIRGDIVGEGSGKPLELMDLDLVRSGRRCQPPRQEVRHHDRLRGGDLGDPKGHGEVVPGGAAPGR